MKKKGHNDTGETRYKNKGYTWKNETKDKPKGKRQYKRVRRGKND